MVQENVDSNNEKAEEILEEVRYLMNNGRHSEIIILLSQVVPKIADDEKRSQALDILNMARINLKNKFDSVQNEGINILKEGIALTKLNNFTGAKQKIQQGMNIFSRLSWKLGSELAKGVLLINNREKSKFEMKQQVYSSDQMMEETRTHRAEREIIELLREGLYQLLDKKFDGGILQYKRVIPMFNNLSIIQKEEMDGIYQHVRDIVDSYKLESFGQIELPLTKLFLD